MIKSKVLRKNPDMVTRTIEDEIILIPIYRTSYDANCIYTLNKAASEVWELIDGKRTLGAIKKIILERYDTADEEIEKEMQEFLKDLTEIKAII